MSPTRFGALALGLGLCLGTAIHAPAAWLAQGIEQASDGRVRMPNARGSVWSGHADLVLSGGVGSAAAAGLPQGLSWSVRPTWGPRGPALALRLNAPCCTPQGMQWQLAWNRGPELALSPHRSAWPMQWFSGLGTPWNTLDLDGRLRFETHALALQWRQGRVVLVGNAEVRAEDLSTRLTTLSPLGSYRLQISPDRANGVAFQLSTLSGALVMNAEGQWSPGQLRLRGLAEAQSESVDALSNLLNILGRREGARAHLSLG
jgi:general secretion pathway protein N